MGVVVRRYNYRYSHNNYYFSLYTPLVLAFWGQQHPYFFVHFLNVFFILVYIYICTCRHMYIHSGEHTIKMTLMTRFIHL